ncbi:hypothetical protein DPEC_G00147230 [Dallia pectoralis]|uniref:Uncharacterized protein n=1 Tax=Dallia pectoralis TaxID=75939 RepID=A0ACC2GI90_DALPE|nr:hypothetical protein DPEC_G00147230 [Dallia pectoralis]
MIIYKDIITGDELFTEVYKITEVCDGMLYEVQGKLTSRSEDVDGALIGANASAEGGDEGSEASTVSGVDIVLNSKLQETSAYNKKAYQMYIKGYMKAVKAKLEEQKSSRVQAFMAGAPAAVKMILANLDKYQFFTGETALRSRNTKSEGFLTEVPGPERCLAASSLTTDRPDHPTCIP